MHLIGQSSWRWLSRRFGAQPAVTYDLVVYGGTSAGIIAAVQAQRMGKSVVIVAPETHLGGLSSGGLGFTDTGNKAVIGGLSREFYQRVWAHYDRPAAWTWQKREEYGNKGQGTPAIDGEHRTMWIFEPHVAERVFEDLVKEHRDSRAPRRVARPRQRGREERCAASRRSRRSAAALRRAGCSSTRPTKAT